MWYYFLNIDTIHNSGTYKLFYLLQELFQPEFRIFIPTVP